MRKPQLRGLLRSYVRTHAIIATVLAATAVVAFKFAVADPRKQKYADFYRDYDAKCEFDKMRVKGVFQCTGN